MKNALPTIVSVVASLLCALPAHAICKPVNGSPVPEWGGNEAVVIELRNHPVRVAHGIVVLAGQPAAGALLQVFKRDHSDPLSVSGDRPQATPIAACATEKDGLFAFDFAPGEYEIRASLGPEIDVTSVLIVVKRGWRRSKQIEIPMHIGT